LEGQETPTASLNHGPAPGVGGVPKQLVGRARHIVNRPLLLRPSHSIAAGRADAEDHRGVICLSEGLDEQLLPGNPNWEVVDWHTPPLANLASIVEFVDDL
jgi:hypothetical protein